MEYSLKAANQQNQYAFRQIGNHYEHGYGVEQDYSKALYYYIKAAEKDSSIINHIRYITTNNQDVKTIFSNLVENIQKEDKINADTLYILGVFYEYGYGVEKDNLKALDYFIKSGKADGFNSIGDFYKNGYGVQQDYSKAIDYYLKSDNGNDYACRCIEEIYENGFVMKYDYSCVDDYYLFSIKSS